MFNRRMFLASAATSVLATPSLAAGWFGTGKDKFEPQVVDVNPNVPAGQIHVTKETFFLYWTLGDGRAVRYGVALGGEGRNYHGMLTIRRKAEWPSWTPTANMIKLEPHIYGPYKRGLPGGHPRNPMGSRAMYLYDGNRPTYYRIHGTPEPETIGTGFSSGCVRLTNEHVAELYNHVPNGTKVFIL